MKALRRLTSAVGIFGLLSAALVPTAANAATSSMPSCSEYFDESGQTVRGLSCTNIASLTQLPLTGDITWIHVQTPTAQQLSGLEILGQNPQLQSIELNVAPAEIIPELSKVSSLEELNLSFANGNDTNLASLGKLTNLKKLKVTASGSTDYRWAQTLSNLEELELHSYTKPIAETRVGQNVSFAPLIGVDGKSIKPWEIRTSTTSTPGNRLANVSTTGATALRPGIATLMASLDTQEAQISTMPRLTSVSYSASWKFGIRDTATFTPIRLSQNASFAGHVVAVVGDRLIVPDSNYPMESRQWTRNGIPIPGQTGESYLLTQDDANAVIAVDYSTKGVLEQGIQWLPATKGSIRYGAPIASSVAAIVKPKITGSKIVGEKLSAQVDASLFPGFKRSYQWNVDQSSIPGATSSTYTPPVSYAGRKISVTVYFYWSDDYTASLPTSSAVTVAKGNFSVAKPTITGTAKVGSKLTATAATPSPAAQTTTYQWMRNGVKITGATAKTYTLTPADMTMRMSVAVKYTKTNYNSKTVTSAATASVLPGTFTVVTKPVITGTKATGKVLKVSPGTYSTSNVSVTYQWARSGVRISTATKASYTVTKADYGKTLSVTVTARKAGYRTVTTTVSKK